ncbi:MAG: YncE family protein [Thermoplasmata archaeon]|nr:YncE family protein [Thermoplasmata archaeon]
MLLLATSLSAIPVAAPTPVHLPVQGAGVHVSGLQTGSKLRLDPPSLAGWNPASGKSSPGMPSYRLYTLPRASASCSQAYSSPAWLAYDPANGNVWVATPPSCLDEYTPISHSVGLNLTAAVPVGMDPFGVAVDNLTDDVFVTNTGSDNVTVVSGSTAVAVANITVGTAPYGVAYDWASNDIYVANGGSNNVTIISGATLSVVGTVAAGSRPIGIVCDPLDGKVFVANSGSANVTVLSDASNTAVGSVSTGNGSYGIALDNASDSVYVTNEGANNISVVNASTDSVVATIPVLAPLVDLQGIAYDPTTRQAWAGGGPSFAVVVNASSNTLLGYAGSDPSGVVFDPSTGAVCVTNTANLTFECISFVSYGTDALPLAFQETGLPGGTVWQVDANFSYGGNLTVQASSGPNITFGLWPFTGWAYQFNIPSVDGFAATPSNGSETTTGSSVVVPILFVRTTGVYPITFLETGLPSGTSWAVDLNGTVNRSTTTTDTFWEPNGTYGYKVEPVTGYFPWYLGVVQVSGGPVLVNVTWLRTYSVWFNETGLPAGSNWSVSLNGTLAGYQSQAGVGPSLEFALPNGSGRFWVTPIPGYIANPWTQAYTVAGLSLSIVITWAEQVYPVTFTAAGLPVGTAWSGTIDAVTMTSVTANLNFTEPNGTYRFEPGLVPGWTTLFSGQTIIVNGSAANQTIAWFQVLYTVAFTESGLPSGTTWSVTINGTEETASIASIMFTEPNGTYAFTVTAPQGYAASPASGTVPVLGAGASQSLAFSAVSLPLTANFTWHLNSATCVANAGVTNSVTLAANASGGTPPYSYAWSLPTGSSTGSTVGTTLTLGGNNTATITVTDAVGGRATHSGMVPMALPPCPSPVQSNGLAAAGVLLLALAIVTVGVIAVSAVVLWFVRRKPQS